MRREESFWTCVCEFSASHYGANNYRNHKLKQGKRADSEENQLSEGDFKGNIQENQRGDL